MRTSIRTKRLFLIQLVLVAALAATSAPVWAQHTVFGQSGDVADRPGGDGPTPTERMMATALEFLRSPDSGVWSGPADTFRAAAAMVDSSGQLVARYERYHLGLRVLDGSVKVVASPDGDASLTIEPEPFEAPMNVIPAVSEDRAWSIVAADLGVGRRDLYGEAELALEPKDGAAALLVWYVRASHPEIAPTDFVIDAISGAVLARDKGYAEDSIDVHGEGLTRPEEVPVAHDACDVYMPSADGVQVELDTLWHNDDDEYFLVDHTRGGTKVLDMQDTVETKDFYGRTYSQFDSNRWGNGEDWEEGDDTAGPTGQTAAVEAMWGAQRTWDMLKNTLNLEGYDGMGEPMILRVHIRKEEDKLYGDAHFDGDYANFGSGGQSEYWSRTQLKTVSHELAHGVWHRLVNDRSRGEARGLNEGHADIAAALVMHYAHLANGEGGTIPTNQRGDLRWFRCRSINPWSYQNSGQTGLAAYTAGMEHREEHTQGTAYGHMFAILAAGMPTLPEADAAPCDGKSYSCLQKAVFPLGVAGIGMDKAGRIWIKATAKYFDSKPTFHEAREAWLLAAQELYGNPSPEYAAVQNAFWLINVGEPAEDMFPPEIQALPPVVDNYEGSVLFDITGLDDIGVVRLDVAVPGDSTSVPGNRFKGYLAAPTVPGPSGADIRAWDASISHTDTTLPFDYASSNRLFLSPFETTSVVENDPLDDGDDDWYVDNWLTATGTMIRSSDPEGAFLGEGYISFANDRWIEREIEIPSDATQVQLGYRYRVKPGMALGSGQLRVEILDDQGVMQETLAVLTPAMDTTQDFSNNYLKNTHTLSETHAGEVITVRFRSLGSEADLFRIDRAFMVYDATPVVEATVEVDEREGSVIMEAEVSGIEPFRVHHVSFLVDGVEIAQDTQWPFQLVKSTGDFIGDVEQTATAIAYDHFGDEIAGSGGADFTVDTVPQLLFNGDFENGDAYWNVVGDVAFCNFNPAGGESHPAFIGIGCMTFEGTASLSRTVAVPANALTASMSFRLDNDSADMTGVDFDVLLISNLSGLVVATLEEISGDLADTDAGTSHKGYRKYVVDLTPYKGMDVSVMFNLDANGAPVTFHLDNVGATYTVFGGGPGGGGPGGIGG